MKRKKVYFIRHGQSKSNEAQKAFKSLIAFDFCNITEKISSLLNILPYDLNSDMTALGESQCKQLSKVLNDDSNMWSEIDIVIHSPMNRTVKTCSILTSSMQSVISPSSIVESALLEEANLFESFNYYVLDERVKRFENWLITLNDAKTALLIGHGTFFQRMLKLNEPMSNCDMWSSELIISSNTETIRSCVWSEPNLVCRVYDDDKVTVSDDVEKTCRICHVTNFERPNLKLISPCLCNGSLSYVHLTCLNTWRATSIEALFKCSVCKYEYNIKKSNIAHFLLSENGPLYLTSLFIALIVFSSGIIIKFLCERYLQIDILRNIYDYIEVFPLWRQPCYNNQRSNQLQMNFHKEQFISRISSPKRFVSYFVSSHFQHYLICQFPLIAALIEVFFLGITIVGSVGTISCLTEDIKDIVRHGFNIHHNSGRRLFGIMIWLITSNKKQMTRIFLLLGCVLGVREVYHKVSIICRKVSQAIGEQVLETRNGS